MHALTKRSAISPQAALEPKEGYCERIKEKPHGSQVANSWEGEAKRPVDRVCRII